MKEPWRCDTVPMGWAGPTSIVIAGMAVAAALWTMLRAPKTGTPGERALWVCIIFLIPIFGPLLYLSRPRQG